MNSHNPRKVSEHCASTKPAREETQNALVVSGGIPSALHRNAWRILPLRCGTLATWLTRVPSGEVGSNVSGKPHRYRPYLPPPCCLSASCPKNGNANPTLLA